MASTSRASTARARKSPSGTRSSIRRTEHVEGTDSRRRAQDTARPQGAACRAAATTSRSSAEAEDGEMAFEMAMKHEPDILLIDVRMPFRSGLDLIEGLNRALPGRIIIIVSGHDEFEYAQAAVKLQVFDYILKPVDADTFIAVIERAKAELESRRRGGKVRGLGARAARAQPAGASRALPEGLGRRLPVPDRGARGARLPSNRARLAGDPLRGAIRGARLDRGRPRRRERQAARPRRDADGDRGVRSRQAAPTSSRTIPRPSSPSRRASSTRS